MDLKHHQNVIPVKSAELLRGRSPSSSNQKPMGCGGDMKDCRDREAWNQELRNNPIYRGYR